MEHGNTGLLWASKFFQFYPMFRRISGEIVCSFSQMAHTPTWEKSWICHWQCRVVWCALLHGLIWLAHLMRSLQGLFVLFARVGSGDHVRALCLFHNKMYSYRLHTLGSCDLCEGFASVSQQSLFVLFAYVRMQWSGKGLTSIPQQIHWIQLNHLLLITMYNLLLPNLMWYNYYYGLPTGVQLRAAHEPMFTVRCLAANWPQVLYCTWLLCIR